MTFPADFILASASPRRRQLLADAGYRFKIEAADIDEPLPEESDDPAAIARDLAVEKARAVASRIARRGVWVLGADTIVVLGRSIIGKPRDRDDAVAILRRLSGSRHAVITGVALVESGSLRSVVRHDETGIHMREIPDDEIARYVGSGGSDGKAGAYAIQEGGDRYVERVDGSLTNVVGLPMELVDRMLREVGIGRPASRT